MGLITFVIKAAIFVWAAKWLVRSIKAAKPGPWNVQYTLPKGTGHRHGNSKGKHCGIILKKSPSDEGIDFLDGLVVDTPIFKFNSARLASSSSNPIRVVATPTTLPNGRFRFEIELPGFRKEHLTVSVDGMNVFVKGARSESQDHGEKTVDFKLDLPENADANDLCAAMADGLLVLDVGKKSNEGRKIVIE
ncbi:hypothetical protein HDU98_006060 [Podochytrium sp. JEL0797]|nr:hypothetical protein HDU98_006060 [Podochytrium sp. JEL0797]